MDMDQRKRVGQPEFSMELDEVIIFIEEFVCQMI